MIFKRAVSRSKLRSPQGQFLVMRNIFLLSLLLFFVGCGPPWGTVTSEEGKYSIKLPSIFRVKQMLPVKTPLGQVNYHLLGSDPTRVKKIWPFWSSHGPYVVAHVDFEPHTYSQEAIQKLFDHERDRILAQAKSSSQTKPELPGIKLDAPISFQGHPGREVSILLDNNKTSHVRMYFVEKHFYILYGIGKNIETFFSSFTLLETK